MMVPMGTMRERTPGTWELVVSAGLDPTTGRYRREIRRIKTTSKREAKAALAELETAVAAGRVSSDDPTLGQLLERSAAMLPAVSIGVALCCLCQRDFTAIHWQIHWQGGPPRWPQRRRPGSPSG